MWSYSRKIYPKVGLYKLPDRRSQLRNGLLDNAAGVSERAICSGLVVWVENEKVAATAPHWCERDK
jgi:hypothetical protein